MGFEVIYYYKEKNEEGWSDEVKEKKARIGQSHEDIPIGKLAGKVMSQMARRNILVTDVKIYEYTKKEVSYKETSDGILIKNKKFKFDDGEDLVTECIKDDDLEKKLLDLLAENPDIVKKITSEPVKHPHENLQAPARTVVNQRAVKYEIYDPSIHGEIEVRNAGMKFTVGKKYAIIREERIGTKDLGRTIYVTNDDSGKEVKISADHFVAPTVGVSIGPEPRIVGAEKEEVDLWGNVQTHENRDTMPDLRR